LLKYDTVPGKLVKLDAVATEFDFMQLAIAPTGGESAGLRLL